MKPGFLKKHWKAATTAGFVATVAALKAGLSAETFSVSMQDAANIVTILGLPAAVYIFLEEQRKERENEEEELDDQLQAEYRDILDNFIEHPELDDHEKDFDINKPEEKKQAQRQYRIYQKIISIFASSYRRLYDQTDDPNLNEMWESWEDWIVECLRWPNFTKRLDALLDGESASFVEYMKTKAKAIAKEAVMPSPPGGPV